jgi:NADP-dependent 3-hydroxy acid dehydrogenase YdfG
MPGPLDGRTAAITGASSGIGEATALALAGAGAAVALGARRADRIQALAERIEADGGRAVAIEVDVGDEAAARGFVERAHSEHAVSQPAHVSINEMLVRPTGQQR